MSKENITIRKKYPLNEVERFDITETLMKCIIHNMKRSEAIMTAMQYCESIGLLDIPNSTLINLYNTARKQLFDYRLANVEEEKKKVVERLYRVGCKAEAAGDFANALRAYNRIAEIAGVNDAVDDSKVILNFVPAKVIESKAEEILEVEYNESIQKPIEEDDKSD